MFHSANASVGLLLIGLALLGAPPSASALTGVRADTCVAVSTEGHIVADRVGREIARCEQLRPDLAKGQSAPVSVSDPVLVACIATARADGFRPADRLEQSILACVHEGGG